MSKETHIRFNVVSIVVNAGTPPCDVPDADLIYHGIKVRWRFTGELEWNEATVEGFTHTLHFLVSDCGKELQAQSAYVNIDGEAGPWGNTLTYILPHQPSTANS